MAEPQEDDDKQHEATQKKLDDARRKGEVPRSADLGTAASYSGFLVVALLVTFVAYSSCVNYAVYEDIVLKNVSGSMDEKIDEIGSE